MECSDLSRYNLRSNEKWNMAAFSKQEIANDTYADQIDEGSTTPEQALAEHKFYPCVEISEAPRKWEVDVTLTIEAGSEAEAKAKATELISMIAKVS
jgi:hypothetical protein